MEIQVSEMDYCKLQVSCNANTDEINSKREEVLKVFRHAPMSGFRKGKATDQAIKYRYKSQIDDALKRALAEEAFHQSIVEKSIKPLGTPQFTEIFLHLNDFSCKFVVNSKPEFELMDLSTLEVPKPHQPVNEQDYAQTLLQELRVEHSTKVPFTETDVVENGDMVSINYEAFLDEAKIDGLSSEGELVTVGSSKLPQFDEALIGMKSGDIKNTIIVIPESAPNDIAGKALTFTISLQMGVKVIPAGLDDELAKKLGRDTFADLEKLVSEEAFKFVSDKNKSAMQQAVVARLVAGHDFQVPDWLSVAEAKYIAATAKIDWDPLSEQTKESYVEQAQKNVRLSLILDKIRENEPEAQLSDQEVVEIIKRHLDPSKSVEEALREISNMGYLQILSNRIRDEYTLDFVVKAIKVIE